MDGAVDGRLPNLQIPFPEESRKGNTTRAGPVGVKEKGKVLAAKMIPGWVDTELDVVSGDDELEGYKDVMARDESRAWVALLEGAVHAALVCRFYSTSHFT